MLKPRLYCFVCLKPMESLEDILAHRAREHPRHLQWQYVKYK